jgi:hypothetical protein
MTCLPFPWGVVCAENQASLSFELYRYVGTLLASCCNKTLLGLHRNVVMPGLLLCLARNNGGFVFTSSVIVASSALLSRHDNRARCI